MEDGYIVADRALQVAERGYRIVRDPPDLTTVTLEKDLNMFCYTGFNDENFMFTTDPDGRLRLYIVDFGHASFLPPSFLAFAVFEPRRRWFLCPWIADKFGASLPRGNLEVMSRICYVFQISAWTIGLTRKQRASDTMNQLDCFLLGCY